MNFKSIITISGRICAGKSFASNLIASKFHFPIASFGGYLKDYSEKNNLPIERKSLQDLGQKRVANDPDQFVLDVIDHFIGSNDVIIMEGIRHFNIFEVIKRLSPNTTSIFIDADQETRYNRYVERNKDSDQSKTYAQFKESDNHPVELEIESLKTHCNIVVDSTKDYSNELYNFLLESVK